MQSHWASNSTWYATLCWCRVTYAEITVYATLYTLHFTLYIHGMHQKRRSSVQPKMVSTRSGKPIKTPLHLPTVAVKAVRTLVWLTAVLFGPVRAVRRLLPLSTPLLQWWCAHRLQAPQHFRPIETQTSGDGYFSRQSVCSVIFLSPACSG